jgi:hypothetical protein
MTMTAEKRSVTTDALETLGTIINAVSSERDAIHLAVEPVYAGEKLYPAQEVCLLKGPDGLTYAYASLPSSKKLGIVDPFLKDPVMKGDKFWFILKPRQITSLRHVWSHPDFEEPAAEVKTVEVTTEPELLLEEAKKIVQKEYPDVLFDPEEAGVDMSCLGCYT